jgi:hypothetical protein
MQFERFFSLDSPKAIKARHFGYLNAINYMAPADTAGYGNVCGDASPGCLALCLGWFSGQAGIVKKGTRRNSTGKNRARQSRVAKVKLFMHDRVAFMAEMVAAVDRAIRAAFKLGLQLCARPNGSSDIPWEHIKLSPVDRRSIFDVFPQVQFVDYTKSLKRMLRFCAGLLPANYHLTFSASEINQDACRQVLAAGGNVAVVFNGEQPATYFDVPVVDGDTHDLRHLDPRGCVIGLTPKGAKAKRDRSGFVVRTC